MNLPECCAYRLAWRYASGYNTIGIRRKDYFEVRNREARDILAAIEAEPESLTEFSKFAYPIGRGIH